MNQKPKIVNVVGTTASGKSDLAIELAKKFAGEVISADSRQVYINLDVGTAKVTKAEMQEIPHYLLDLLPPTQVYSVEDFKKDAEKAISAIIQQRKLPIIAGGTFYYTDALLGRVSTSSVPPNHNLRVELEEKTTEDLFKKLIAVEPRRASTIDKHNRRRLIRALEITNAVGYVPEATKTPSPYQVLTIGCIRSKEELLERFKVRIATWLDGSLEQEVRSLLASGVPEERLRELGFEYSLMLDYLQGSISKEDLPQKYLEKNWQYAKRQLTWLKRDETIQWYDPTDKKIFEVVREFLQCVDGH